MTDRPGTIFDVKLAISIEKDRDEAKVGFMHSETRSGFLNGNNHFAPNVNSMVSVSTWQRAGEDSEKHDLRGIDTDSTDFPAPLSLFVSAGAACRVRQRAQQGAGSGQRQQMAM